jgi:hypothetical protein
MQRQHADFLLIMLIGGEVLALVEGMKSLMLFQRSITFRAS